jgi:hypothetical protein
MQQKAKPASEVGTPSEANTDVAVDEAMRVVTHDMQKYIWAMTPSADDPQDMFHPQITGSTSELIEDITTPSTRESENDRHVGAGTSAAVAAAMLSAGLNRLSLQQSAAARSPAYTSSGRSSRQGTSARSQQSAIAIETMSEAGRISAARDAAQDTIANLRSLMVDDMHALTDSSRDNSKSSTTAGTNTAVEAAMAILRSGVDGTHPGSIGLEQGHASAPSQHGPTSSRSQASAFVSDGTTSEIGIHAVAAHDAAKEAIADLRLLVAVDMAEPLIPSPFQMSKDDLSASLSASSEEGLLSQARDLSKARQMVKEAMMDSGPSSLPSSARSERMATETQAATWTVAEKAACRLLGMPPLPPPSRDLSETPAVSCRSQRSAVDEAMRDVIDRISSREQASKHCASSIQTGSREGADFRSREGPQSARSASLVSCGTAASPM